MDGQPEHTLQDVVDAMRELRAKVRTLPADAGGLKPTADDWTVGQILMHVAMSHRFSADQIEYARRNQPIDASYFDPNRALVAEAQSQSLAEITARLESEQDRLVTWLKTVPTDSWTETYTAVLPWGTRQVDVAGIGTRLKAHYADHVQQIDDWLARSGGQRV